MHLVEARPRSRRRYNKPQDQVLSTTSPFVRAHVWKAGCAYCISCVFVALSQRHSLVAAGVSRSHLLILFFYLVEHKFLSSHKAIIRVSFPPVIDRVSVIQRDPTLLGRLVEEQQAVLGDINTPLTWEHLGEMELLHNTMRETLRMFPPLVGHQCPALPSVCKAVFLGHVALPF